MILYHFLLVFLLAFIIHIDQILLIHLNEGLCLVFFLFSCLVAIFTFSRACSPQAIMRAGILLWSAAPLFIRLQSFTSQQIDPLARFRKQPTVVPDAASGADPPPAAPPVLDVNNVASYPLARFKRQRKSESSSISSSPSAPATSSSSSSSYSIGGLNYLPRNAPNFFNTILPTLHNETLTPGGPVSSGEITAAEKAALPLHIRYNAPIKRRLAARKTARTYTHESACLV
eukprot:g72806.t1